MEPQARAGVGLADGFTAHFATQGVGILGLAVAAPLAGAGIVLVKELYLHVPPEQEVLPDETSGPLAA